MELGGYVGMIETKNIASQFAFEGELIEIKKITQGYINATFCLTYQKEDKRKRYILQNINTEVFHSPKELMGNIQKVTSHIRAKIQKSNSDAERRVLTLVPTTTGELYFTDKEQHYWRAYHFIENATAYQSVEKRGLFYQSAKAFGHFQRLLADFPAQALYETIPHFHDTPKRLADFIGVMERDCKNRVKKARKECDFILNHKADCDMIVNLIAEGKIPLRVTHNDTKLNNVMIDNDTNEAVCVLDLDTVMPGTVLFDYGDSIRFGASTALEDEKDLDQVSLDLTLFEEYTKGFLEEAKGALNTHEIQNLALGARVITLEQGIRFLADYLSGDVYYPVSYPEHNLVRARTQLKLVQEMEEKSKQMNEIIQKYAE